MGYVLVSSLSIVPFAAPIIHCMMPSELLDSGLVVASILRSLAAPKSSIVVDVGDFVAHVRAVVLFAFHSLRIDQPLVLSLDACATF